MKILIAHDGSPYSEKAIKDLPLAGLPDNTEALILCVVAPLGYAYGIGVDPVYGGLAPLAIEDAREYKRQSGKLAAEWLGEAERLVRLRFPLWKVRIQAMEGDPAGRILEKAASWKADLIVMGSHGHSALTHLLLGSVTQKVLHHAGTSVRISRGLARPKSRPPRLLVGFDGSADCDLALREIASRNWRFGTQVRLVAAFDNRLLVGNLVKEYPIRTREKIRSLRADWGSKKMEAAVDRLNLEGFKADYEIVYGDPRRALVRKAADWPADCIFLGSRGLKGWERFMVGSVSSSIAIHAKCTVEVVRSRKTGKP